MITPTIDWQAVAEAKDASRSAGYAGLTRRAWACGIWCVALAHWFVNFALWGRIVVALGFLTLAGFALLAFLTQTERRAS